MNGLRYWVAATAAWLLVFGNLERLHASLSIASFVYVLTAGVAIAMLVVPRIGSASPIPLGGAVIAGFLVLKALLGHPVGGAGLPATVAELCGVAVTIALVRGIVQGIGRVGEATAEAAVVRLDEQLASFEHGQEEIYREIRRARMFERPLVLATITATETSVRHSLDRFLEEIKAKTVEKYVYGRIGDVLIRRTSVCDLIARRNNHFILLLPEADRHRAGEVLRRLSKSIEEELGLNVQSGLATFPEEEVTFTGLLERAEGEMQGRTLVDGQEHEVAERPTGVR